MGKKHSWNDAVCGARKNFLCQKGGGHLAMIKTKATHDFVTNTWNNDFWIGISDISKEGNYQFVDGTPVKTAYWHPGQPDNFGNREDCIHYVLKKHSWNDAVCGARKNFLCQVGGPS